MQRVIIQIMTLVLLQDKQSAFWGKKNSREGEKQQKTDETS